MNQVGPRAWVLHVDMDQFIAAVELLRRPELVGLPVVVGGRGDPTERAVVATASYEARAFGVRSGMPMKVAVKRCPDAVFLPSDMAAYQEASQQVMDTLKAVPGARVEVLGMDEAFVGVDSDDIEALARSVQRAVLDRTRLHCSIGIGDTLVRAKTATEFGKPQGTYQLTRANWFDVMGERPVGDLWGVGPQTAKALDRMAIHTVVELAAAREEDLVAAFGNVRGRHVHTLGLGEGRDVVDDTPWVARAHGHETTYQIDLLEEAEIRAALRTLAEAVMVDLNREGRPCQRVFLKVRFAPFFTFNRSRKLREPTTDPSLIAETAYDLLTKLEDERPIRLLGIRGEMVPPEGGY